MDNTLVSWGLGGSKVHMGIMHLAGQLGKWQELWAFVTSKGVRMIGTGQLCSGAEDPAKRLSGGLRRPRHKDYALCNVQKLQRVRSEQAGGNVSANFKGRGHVIPSEGGAGFRRPTRRLLCEKKEHRVICLPSSERLKPAHKHTRTLILSFLHSPLRTIGEATFRTCSVLEHVNCLM